MIVSGITQVHLQNITKQFLAVNKTDTWTYRGEANISRYT